MARGRGRGLLDVGGLGACAPAATQPLAHAVAHALALVHALPLRPTC